MPRTKLDMLTPERQREITNKTLRHYMVEKEIRTPSNLAPLVGITPRTMRRRFDEGGWTIEELQKLVRFFGITAEDAGKILGCKTAS